MRRVLFVCLGVASIGCVAHVQNITSIEVSAERFDDAYAELAPYGAWSEDETYGDVWTPNAEDFVPYGNDGRFADLGTDLVWVSDVPWGTTLHHGRWVHSKKRWRWVPGKTYAGAWVRLVHDGSRTSWSPEPPTHVWRHGRREAIAATPQPTVGSRDDEELALVPPPLPPKQLERERDVATSDAPRHASADAAEAFAGGWDDGVVMSGGGSHGHHGGGGSWSGSSGGHSTVTSTSRFGGGSSSHGASASSVHR